MCLNTWMCKWRTVYIQTIGIPSHLSLSWRITLKGHAWETSLAFLGASNPFTDVTLESLKLLNTSLSVWSFSFIYLLKCMCACHSVLTEVRGQLSGVGSLLPPCGFQGPNLGHLAYSSLLDEPFPFYLGLRLKWRHSLYLSYMVTRLFNFS